MTLSGGQKARVSLARTLYSEADIYVLDDPLSAVEVKVARNIFEDVFLGLLKGKIIILSTHQVHFLDHCNYIIALERGRIAAFDEPEKLHAIFQQLKEQEQMEKKFEKKELLGHEEKPVSREEENVAITFESYKRYFYHRNCWQFPLSLLIFLISEGILAAWMRIFNSYDDQVRDSEFRLFDSLHTFWTVQGILCALLLLSLVAKYMFLSLTVLRINENLHEDMIEALARSHCYYFDVVASGRLANKFSNDLGVLDNSLVFILQNTLEGPILALVLMVNVFQINPYFIVVGVGCAIGLVLWLSFMKPVVLEAKQLDLKMKTPVFTQLGQAVSGLVQIRIFDRMTGYFAEINANLNSAYRANIFYSFSARVLGAYLSIIVTLAMVTGMFIGIRLTTPSTTGEYAFSVTFFIFCVDYVQWGFRQYINAESNMVSAERCFRMAEVQHEKPISTDYDQQLLPLSSDSSESNNLSPKSARPPRITLANFRMKYRPELPLVLRGVNIGIEPGEKVGIVGRTGAGKSSIIQSLLRIC